MATQLNNDFTSMVVTSTVNSQAIRPTEPFAWSQHYINVTAVSGTSPTLDIVLQESNDGLEWRDRWHFERVSAVTSTQLRTPYLPHRGVFYRYSFTVGGTNPSFTLSTSRVFDNNAPDGERYQFINRTLDLATGSSTTPFYDISGADTISVDVQCGTFGAAATLRVDTSNDGVSAVGLATISISSAGTFNGVITTRQARYMRVLVSSAGAGSAIGTAGVTLKAWKA